MYLLFYRDVDGKIYFLLANNTIELCARKAYEMDDAIDRAQYNTLRNTGYFSFGNGSAYFIKPVYEMGNPVIQELKEERIAWGY